MGSEPGAELHDSDWRRQLELLRPYLLTVASRKLNPALRGRVAASDVVQETLLEAELHRQEAALPPVEELPRWLQTILENNIRDAARHAQAQCRAVDREVTKWPSAALRTGDSQAPEALAMRSETLGAMDAALAQLDAPFREIIHLRHERKLRFADIAGQLGISEQAAQRLWARAVHALRAALKAHR